MGIKRYIVLALIFIAAVGLYVFSFNGQSFTLEALGLSLTLPVAAWIIVPVSILMLVSITHLFYYSMKHYMEVRAHKKDYENFLKSAKQILMYENSEATYKLRQDNPLVIQNQLNKLNSNPKMASEILRDESCDKQSKLYKKAWEITLSTAAYAEIQRLNLPLEEKDILLILSRYASEEDALYMENDALENILKNEVLSRAGLVEAAKILQKKLTPDGVIALFEKLYNNKAEASYAFLYLLFELQMIDRAREILENSDGDDFKEYKLLLFLRDHGKHCETSFFVK